MQKFDEGTAQLPEVTAIGVQVIGLDISNHRNHRLQMQERGVALVSFGDQDPARSQSRVSASAVQQAADDEGGILARLSKNGRDETGCRCFPVSSR